MEMTKEMEVLLKNIKLATANETLEKKVKELEEKVEELEHEKMYREQMEEEPYSMWDDDEPWDIEEERQKLSNSTDNLIQASPNFQYVLQHGTEEHIEKQAEMILKLYELVFARVHAYKAVMDANGKIIEFMENGLIKGVQ